MDRLARFSESLGEKVERRTLLKGLAMSSLVGVLGVLGVPIDALAAGNTVRGSTSPANPDHCCPYYACTLQSGGCGHCSPCSPSCGVGQTCSAYKCVDTCGSGELYYTCTCTSTCGTYHTC